MAALYVPEVAAGAAARGATAMPPADAGKSVSTFRIEPFAGLYWSDARFEARRVSVEEGKAYYRSGAEAKGSALTPLGSGGRFRVPGSATEIAFEDSGSGTPAGKRIVERDPDEDAEAATSTWLPVAETRPANLARFAGAYFCEELDATYRVAVSGGALVLARRGAEPEPLPVCAAFAAERPKLPDRRRALPPHVCAPARDHG